MLPIDYLKELSFVRMGGSEMEHKAANLIAGWLEQFGYKSTIEEFEIGAFKPGSGTLKTIEPNGDEVHISPVGLSANCDVEGELMILDIPEPEWADKNKLKDKIVLMAHYPRRKWVNLLYESGAKCGITVVDDIRINAYIKLGQEVADDFGDKFALATIGYKYAIDLVNKGIERVKVHTEQEKFIGKSHNVIAEIPGKTDRTIILTAHYDSTPSSPGAQDNAAGCVEMLDIAKSLAGKKFERTIKFIFCGSEEMGLLGSKAFSESHIDELDKIDFLINLDVGGNPFNPVFARALGTEKLQNFIEGFARSNGLPIDVSQNIYSSDSMPFARFGIPSVSIGRGGISSRGHSPYDTTDRTCNEALDDIAKYAQQITEKIADSELLPFPRKISEEMMKKVNEYFSGRK
ncbi:M20/M25/M40 family metallo-hydrolase [bacterium]|nr:M20/M25/M40 family metallo-hydrolase [bacterium]